MSTVEAKAAGQRSERAGSGRGPLFRLPRPAVLGRALLGFFLLFLALEIASRTSGLSEQTLPRGTTVLRTMGIVASDPAFYGDVWATLQAAMTGLAVSIAIAVPLGVALGSSLPTYRALIALVELVRPVPSVAIIPVALLLFGLGMSMKVFLVVFTAVWIVMFNTLYAVRDVDPVLTDTARVYGLNRAQVLIKVTLRHALPFIYTGIRIAVVAALIVTISAELLSGGGQGLGRWLRRHEEAATLRHFVFAGAFLTGVLGVIINFLLDVGERRFFSWSNAGRKRS